LRGGDTHLVDHTGGDLSTTWTKRRKAHLSPSLPAAISLSELTYPRPQRSHTPASLGERWVRLNLLLTHRSHPELITLIRCPHRKLYLSLGILGCGKKTSPERRRTHPGTRGTPVASHNIRVKSFTSPSSLNDLHRFCRAWMLDPSPIAARLYQVAVDHKDDQSLCIQEH